MCQGLLELILFESLLDILILNLKDCNAFVGYEIKTSSYFQLGWKYKLWKKFMLLTFDTYYNSEKRPVTYLLLTSQIGILIDKIEDFHFSYGFLVIV